MTFVVLFSFLSISSASGALEVSDISISPSVVWLHERPDMTISAKCLLDGSPLPNATAKAEIYPPGSSVPTASPNLVYDSGGGIYKRTFQESFSGTGTYTVKVTCSYKSNTADSQGSFAANELKLRIISDFGNPADVYMGGKLTFRVEFLKNNILVAPSQDTFSVWIGDERVSVTSLPIIDGNYQKIEVKIPLDPDDLEVGIFDLKVKAFSDGSNVQATLGDIVRVNTPLTMDIISERIKCAAGAACNGNLGAKVVFYDGEIDDFTADKNFQALLKDGREWINVYVSSVECDKTTEVCDIGLDIPPMDPGEYTVYIRVASPSISSSTYESQDSLPLEVIIPFNGHMRDAGGDAVDMTMTFINEDTGKIDSVNTVGDGEYSLELLPGIYTVELKFTKGDIVKFYNVSITSKNLAELPGSFMRYDSGHLNAGKPPGLRLVRTVVFEFDLPYKRAWAYVPYDSSIVRADENDLEVYTCKNWNFKRGDCTGDWKRVSGEVHTIRDAIEFDISRGAASAYVIGEKKTLHFSRLSLDRDSVNLEGDLYLSGKVLDNDGNQIEGAEIIARFEELNITKTGLTGRDGSFEVLIVAPEEEGVFELVVTAKKGETFTGESSSQMVTVKRSVGLGILGTPDIVTAELGRSIGVNLILFNSGQKNLTKPIYVHISGISSEWYRLAPVQVNSLGIGEQKDVTMNFLITDKMCGESCQEFYLVNVEAKSEEVSQASSFTLKIAKSTNATAGETYSGGIAAEGEDPLSGLLTAITANVIENQTNLVIIVLLGLFIFVTVMKRKTGGGRREAGGGLMALNPNRGGISGLPGGGLLGGSIKRDSNTYGQLYDIKRRL